MAWELSFSGILTDSCRVYTFFHFTCMTADSHSCIIKQYYNNSYYKLCSVSRTLAGMDLNGLVTENTARKACYRRELVRNVPIAQVHAKQNLMFSRARTVKLCNYRVMESSGWLRTSLRQRLPRVR